MARLDLSQLDRYIGFIKGEDIDRFLSEFNIKLASGTWAAGDFSDRFMRGGYNPDIDTSIVGQLKRIREAGFIAYVPIDVQFKDRNLRIDWSVVENVKSISRELELKPIALAMDISGVNMFKHGSIANPCEDLRKRALEVLTESMDIAKALGVDTVSFWPGQDGWDYSFEVNYGKMLKIFMNNLKELAIRAADRGLTLGIEAKVKEPREGNMIIPTSHASILMAKRINDELGKKVVGITIDYGHELMYAVEPAYTVYLAKEFDVPLLSIHINTAKTHSNDEDRVVGTGDLWQFIDFLYATVDIGFDGWYALDQFTYRMNPVEGLRKSKLFFVNAYKKALLLYRYRDELEKLREEADQGKILEFVGEIIYSK
ncbi:Xylose isomerase domain protein TIM barrel [Ignisphaera aggregans DSM 17230]|uniref:Xylose isomerase domain protein TIM barrel n=1 Tax=Ignisphaera aggregans (strain DSM 17230 / JCM 13409 / AQ1.S1) TaxID=583356 RepID=E0SR43_IGNAA|nr:Xylose isomerase domain protein TIM barrel [Ignisphaera aggregans DSM 17230]